MLMINGQLLFWKKLEKNVLNIQRRIYKAIKAGKIGKAKKLASIEKHKFNYFECQTGNPRQESEQLKWMESRC